MGILNHSTNSSLMALTKGCPSGPYGMHKAEYLHLQALNPAAFAAATSICTHSLCDSPEAWCPQVALEKPAPENNTLACLDILASLHVVLSVPLDFFILVFNIFS